MINISDSARDRLVHLLDSDGSKNSFVRVGVESGGCSGLSYKLDFDGKKMKMMSLLKTIILNF